jgi:hypothetical protein
MQLSYMRHFYTLLLVLGSISSLFSQQTFSNFWKPVPVNDVVLPAGATRETEPLHYTAYQLDYNGIAAELAKAPVEFTADALTRKVIVRMPQSDGAFEDYEMVSVATMMPGLAAKFPEIRTYGGKSVETPGKTIRITCSPYRGLEAMVRHADKNTDFVELMAKGQGVWYMAYDNKDAVSNTPPGLERRMDRPVTTAPAAPEPPRYSLGEPVPKERGLTSKPVSLHVYRFACSTTGEYAAENGATLAGVMSKVVSTTNNLNAIYEADLDVRLELINDEDKIIFLDAATDPYTGTTVEGWYSQNPAAINQALGNSGLYDIGHLFAKYLNGSNVLGLGGHAVCCTQVKAYGCSSGNVPYGPYFFGVVGQEIGHQWGALHTWNNCPGQSDTAGDSERCEPGSGSTIMSYAGSCSGPNNVVNQADLYYDICSIVSIRNFIESGVGSACGTNMQTTNNAPMVTIPYADNFFIPINTPFELIGSATDPDGEQMTYNWDEIDLGPASTLGSPTANAPLFRSLPPTTLPRRTFPRISTVITNTTSTSEVLPSYNRDLTFCLIARDGHVGAGGIGFDTVSFHSTTTAGPFLVNVPNMAGTVWNIGDFQDVIWDVAHTDSTLVNCKLVNIRLSTDGGFTYPDTLAKAVSNNGRYCVSVPNKPTSTARIRVEAADNIFFDISNTNFKIQAPAQADFSLCLGKSADHACLPAAYTTIVSSTGLKGFNTPITLSATGLPAGATVSFSPNPVAPGSDATMTVTFQAGTAEGNADIVISGTAGSVTKTVALRLTTVSNNFAGFNLVSPPNGASGVSHGPSLKWTTVPDANAYDVQVASNPSFLAGTIIGATAAAGTKLDSFKVPVILSDGQTCYWRVRPKNECGEQSWSEPFVFVTSVQSCQTFTALDVPVAISANGTPTIESKIIVPSGAAISSVVIQNLTGYHDNFIELETHLISPANTDVLLWKAKCPGTFDFNFGLDDASASNFSCPPPKTGIFRKPQSPLSAFNGQNAAGTWTLRIKDNTLTNGGSLTAFQLKLCSSAALNGPFIVNNNLLQLTSGTNAAIGNDLLKTDDSNNTPDQLIYTVMTAPGHGELVHGSTLKPGDQFTQADINNGTLRYFDYGLNQGSDKFRFSVTDGAGGLVAGTFTIQPFTVGTKEPTGLLSFDLAPNPADETIRLYFTESLPSDAQIAIFNTAGQLIRSWVAPAGSNMMLLRIEDLPEGVYAVAVQHAGARGVKKVVVK